MTATLRMPKGFELLARASVGSTNDDLKEMAVKDNALEGTVLWAKEQTSGRGRQKRDWVSKPGNMYCSVLFRPNCPVKDAAQIGFLPVIALGEALASMLDGSGKFRYKWPNDLLLNDKKITGVLPESGVDSNGLASWVVVGCGLNLEHHPENTRFPATNIFDELGVHLSLEETLESYIAKLAYWYRRWQSDGFGPVRQAWLGSAHIFDKPLQVEVGAETFVGPFRDLDENGALVIETDSGPRRIDAGEVYFQSTDQEEL